MSQSLPQPGKMTQECTLIIRMMKGTSTYVTRSQGHHVTKLFLLVRNKSNTHRILAWCRSYANIKVQRTITITLTTLYVNNKIN